LVRVSSPVGGKTPTGRNEKRKKKRKIKRKKGRKEKENPRSRGGRREEEEGGERTEGGAAARRKKRMDIPIPSHGRAEVFGSPPEISRNLHFQWVRSF
jgi:hypothetical protein